MAKKLGIILSFYFAIASFSGFSQDLDPLENDALLKFQNAESVSDRFSYFFDTVNRYSTHSAYDWLDAVERYIKNAESGGDSLAIKKYKLIQSQIYFDLGDYDRSVSVATRIYSEKHKLDQPTKELLLNLLDANYSRLELYDKQVEIRKQKRELGLKNNISFYDIYSNLGLHRQAMKDYIMENKNTIEENDYYGLANYHNSIGNFLLLDKTTSTALTNFSKAKGYIEVYLNDMSSVKTESEIINGNLLKGIIDGNIGKCYVQMGQFDKAIPYLETSISTIEENNIGRTSSEVNENVLALAECHLRMDRLKIAKDYLDIELELTKTSQIIKKNRLFAAYYDRTGDFENQALYLKKNVRIRDSLEVNESSIKRQQIAAIISEENLEDSRRMINLQKLEMEQTRSDMAAMDERTNLVFISLIFTLLGFAGLVFAYLKSIKNQRLIAEQKHIIENALVEKDSLLKEIHHRVKNNLQMVSSLLSLQTKNTRSKAAIEALEEGKSRVKAMALIHQKLYQNDDLSVIEMQGYIESLVNSVQSVFKKGGHNINITIDAEGVELDIDRAIPFGLILNELVSNSFKYAFPEDKNNGKIYIHLRKNGDQGFFEYTDNGIGLPDDTDERTNSSMGIRLMNRLVNQLQSTLNIDKTTEGVRFWFNFK
ncbi:MAG: tetratricopeptide repeat protein [Flavobacteriaceae bacterium]|nr:tetratricopeptide repeat protein [Eudoraea sp.]NNK21368.1 tetratricopeptide repeat protein [Flavobacteriaceae bacterium]